MRLKSMRNRCFIIYLLVIFEVDNLVALIHLQGSLNIICPHWFLTPFKFK